MKNLAIILALILVQAQVFAAENQNTNIQKRPAQEASTDIQNASQQKTPSQAQKDEEYLLKYNIRDLEAAPWLHEGKRSYN